MTSLSLTKPSDIALLLKSLKRRPIKRLSQNFLIDKNIVDKLIETANVLESEYILEIGPGLGAITNALLNKKTFVTAVEKDRDFSINLTSHVDNPDNLQVHEKDFLKVDLQSLIKKDKKIKVVSNIPFHLTTPILTKLLPCYEFITSITLIIQKEYANRITSLPNTADYSSITIFSNLYSTVKSTFTVSKNSFFPKPKVSSAIVHFDLIPPRLSKEDLLYFEKFIRKGFQHRRKQLRTSLKNTVNPLLISKLLLDLKLPKTARPQELSLSNFIYIYKNIKLLSTF